MIKTLGHLSIAAIMAAAATPAVADPVKGYSVTYRADRGHYCVRPLTAAVAERFGIELYRTECHSAAGWKTIGLTIARG